MSDSPQCSEILETGAPTSRLLESTLINRRVNSGKGIECGFTNSWLAICMSFLYTIDWSLHKFGLLALIQNLMYSPIRSQCGLSPRRNYATVVRILKEYRSSYSQTDFPASLHESMNIAWTESKRSDCWALSFQMCTYICEFRRLPESPSASPVSKTRDLSLSWDQTKMLTFEEPVPSVYWFDNGLLRSHGGLPSKLG